MIKVPPANLDAGTLRSLVEGFITREGTDYGDIEHSLDEKVSQLLPKIYSGEVIITYEEATESVNLIHRDDPSLAVED